MKILSRKVFSKIFEICLPVAKESVAIFSKPYQIAIFKILTFQKFTGGILCSKFEAES